MSDATPPPDDLRLDAAGGALQVGSCGDRFDATMQCGIEGHTVSLLFTPQQAAELADWLTAYRLSTHAEPDPDQVLLADLKAMLKRLRALSHMLYKDPVGRELPPMLRDHMGQHADRMQRAAQDLRTALRGLWPDGKA